MSSISWLSERLAASKPVWAPLLLAVVFFVLYLNLRRPGLEWGDDWAMYVSHGRNLATGHTYLDTGFLHDRLTASYSPSSSPPVFPALLALVYRRRGFDVDAFKALSALIAALSLLPIALWFRASLGFWGSMLVVALIGGSIGYLDQISGISTDLICVLFLYWFFVVHRWISERSWDKRRPLLAASLVLAPVLLAVFTRIAALPMAGALVVHEVCRNRRFTRFCVYFVLGFVLLFAAISRVFPGGVSYWAGFHIEPMRYLANAIGYAKAAASTWAPHFQSLRVLSFSVFTLLAAYGLWRRLPRGIGVQEWFLVLHLLMLTFYTSGHGYRYLLPIIPIYVGYALEGAWAVASGVPPSSRRAVVFCGVGILLAMPVGNIIACDRQPFQEGPDRPLYRHLLAYVLENTAADSRFVLWKPRLFTLLTGRRAGFYLRTDDEPLFLHNLSERRIDYLVLYKRSPADEQWLAAKIRHGPDVFPTLYDNAEFSLHKVNLREVNEARTLSDDLE